MKPELRVEPGSRARSKLESTKIATGFGIKNGTAIRIESDTNWCQEQNRDQNGERDHDQKRNRSAEFHGVALNKDGLFSELNALQKCPLRQSRNSHRRGSKGR
ncbi:hypothetical protein EVAR_9526_1 [Eumeta japonica]|uniref:Uncharacterized protein n=1 Tax=Eumeta variegata TaxID=151549 RepID=A0A4C1U3I8_EUMVA|nr:hypothetical protein EVAR_9526_1 [Eumeta japonica]